MVSPGMGTLKALQHWVLCHLVDLIDNLCAKRNLVQQLQGKSTDYDNYNLDIFKCIVKREDQFVSLHSKLLQS